MMNKGYISVFVILFIAIVGLGCLSIFNDKDYVITVTDKERIEEVVGSGENRRLKSKYLVFGDDENGNSLVFENTDEWLRGKFNSSNVQGSLKIGYTYKVTAIGFRVPILSLYRNIIKVEEVN